MQFMLSVVGVVGIILIIVSPRVPPVVTVACHYRLWCREPLPPLVPPAVQPLVPPAAGAATASARGTPTASARSASSAARCRPHRRATASASAGQEREGAAKAAHRPGK